ncbi:MAG: hypothetical protein V5A43_04845 [Haloarculaceae archaeon]
MGLTTWPRLGALGFVLVAATGEVAAQSVAPSAVRDLPGSVRAAVAFGLVVVVGAGILLRHTPFVDRAITTSMERPLTSFLYGVVAFGLVGFIGIFLVAQGAQLGIAAPTITTVGFGIAGAVMVVLGSLGYLVVGAKITDLTGERRPWNGVVFGAAIGAVVWLVLPVVVAVAVWVLGAAVGVGGPMREWLHADRSMASDGPV